jgi:Zn-dependent peptidase ImmA (M78 family)
MMDLSEALTIAADHFPKGPEAVAAQMGIEVRHAPLTGCAGWCIRNKAIAIVRINSLMPKTRQRFTLAHELAHLLLGSESEVRSDTDYLGSDDAEERSANHVAAELLLPRGHVERIITSPPVESSSIRKLARKAHVSEVMAACRITDLAHAIGLINAAVVSFADSDLQWIWSKTLDVTPEEARELLKKTSATARRVYRAEYRPG